MAYAADLNSAAARHRGSNPLPGTTLFEFGVDDNESASKVPHPQDGCSGSNGASSQPPDRPRRTVNLVERGRRRWPPCGLRVGDGRPALRAPRHPIVSGHFEAGGATAVPLSRSPPRGCDAPAFRNDIVSAGDGNNDVTAGAGRCRYCRVGTNSVERELRNRSQSGGWRGCARRFGWESVGSMRVRQ